MQAQREQNSRTIMDAPCVVTGGAGAIGSRLVRRLLELGASRVVVIDDLSSGYRWLLPNDARVEFLKHDIQNIGEAIPKLPPSFVFHLAAFFANQNSVDHPAADLRTNGLGTLAALRWAARNEALSFVYASAGCSIAGHDVDGPISEDMPVSLFLDTPYQITKALGEFYCNYYLPQLATVRCRFFNSFGPGEVPGRYRNVIPNFIWSAMRNEPLVITGTGEETRDFIFVEDLVGGLIRCALADVRGEAFNLGTGVETRVIDVASAILQETGSKSEIVYTPRRSWDHSIRRQANISKAREQLSFDAPTAFSDGLSRTVEWFVSERGRIEQLLETK